MIRRSCSFIIILIASLSLLAQDPPNLQNGMPAQGSYDGGSADTVNLMNGNLTLHIPLPISTPQRGKLGIKYYLVVNAKTWKATGDPATLTGQWKPTNLCTTLTTGPCGQGPVFLSTATFGMTREWQSVFTDGVGTDYSVSTPTSIATWDGSTHGLIGSATTLRSTDTSGYRVEISGSDGFGLPDNAVVIDRNGTRYSGSFVRGGCTRTVDGGGLPGSTTTTTCPEYFSMNQVTDANGNVLSPPVAVPELRFDWTMPTVSTHEAIGTEADGCMTSFGTPWVGYVDYPAPNGQTNEIKLCFAVYPQLVTSFSPAGIQQFQAISSGYRQPIYLSNIILPDNTQWSISYDSYGEITNVQTPTGASISYSWSEAHFPVSSSSDITSVSRAVHTRALHDVNGNVFTWTYQWGAQASDKSMSHTVTDPNNNDTVHVFRPIEAMATLYPQNYKETSSVTYQGTGGSRTPLQQVDTTWLIHSDNGPGVPTDFKTTLFPSLKAKLVHRDYDPTSPPLGLVVSQKNYDWGDQGNPGALLSEQDTVYEWQKDGRYLTANLLDLPASTIVVSPVAASNIKASCPADGGGTLKSCMAETDFTYDEASYITSYENTVGALPTGTHVPPANAVSGNLTTVSKWLSTGAPVVSHTNWYDTGEPHIQIDPLGHSTTISYDLAYNGALPTMTCNAKSQCVSATYDLNTGLIASFTDANAASQASGTTQGDPAHTSTYGYDFLGRMTSTVSPADSSGQHPQTTFSYPNLTTVQKLQSITPSLADTLTTHFDGLGHVIRTEHPTPDGTVLVDTSYDGLGHVTSITNPYITTTDPTYGTVQTVYDALGRPTTITEQDQSVKRADYSAGVCVTSFDEAGTQRKSCSDGMGRLVEVDEPNPGAPATKGSGWVTVSGTEQSATSQPANTASVTVTLGGADSTNSNTICITTCRTINSKDTGTLSFTAVVGGVTIGPVSTRYSGSSSLNSLALGLYSAFPANSVVTMSNPGTGNSFTLTTVATGNAMNSSVISTSLMSDCVDSETMFCGGMGWSMTLSGPNLAATMVSPQNFSGGQDASITPDSGQITATINGTPYQVAFGSGDDATTIASRLATAISAGTLASASASGGTVTITSKTFGTPGDYSLSASYTWNHTFINPSFTTSSSGSISGGLDASALNNNPFVTIYSYDALGNLLRVDQKGSAPSDSSQWRTRTFTYDSLSRRLTAYNPESGTVVYSYDADDNLLTKTSPAPNQTSTATQSISYCYDELKRLTKMDYQPHTFTPPACPITNPVVAYSYDTGLNAAGEISSVTDHAGSTSYTYDPLGRMKTETRTTVGITKTVSYDYNLDGALQALHYPSGRTVTYAPDSAGRVTSVTDANGTPYATSLAYWPNGSEYQWHLPNIYLRTDLNQRLQISGFYADNGQTASFFMNKTYSYGPAHQDNGNVMSIINNKDATRTQTYTYDVLNRITSGYSAASSGALSWGENYTIDAWGNLMMSPMSGKAHGGMFQHAGDANNHASGLGYDAAGNLTDYSAPNQYLYDSENRIQSTGGMTYTYDADGNRVKKASGSTGTLYWYGLPGIIAESDLSGNLKSEYVFVNGKRAARIDMVNNSVHYYLSDHLNSTSMVISSAGVVEDESDYSAFGTEYSVISSGTNHYRFSGKERDSESQLDYFGGRFDSDQIGRFLTADDGSDQSTADPESWNLYDYVRNNPVNRMDSGGRDCIVQTRTGSNTETVTVTSGTCDGVKVGDGQSKTYVPGVVDRSSIRPGSDGRSIDFSYTPYDNPAANGVGTAPAAPIPDHPGVAYGYNAQGYQTLGLASRVTNRYIAAPLLAFLSLAAPGALEATGPEITSLGIGRVVAGQIIDLTVETSAGAVRIYCEVGVQGDTVILKDVAIYPANSETPLNVGIKEMRAALRPVLQKMKDAGFRRAVIQAYRVSGATPGRIMNLTVTLK